MPWQLCLASVKPAGTIQVSLAMSKIIPKNSLKFGTEATLSKYAAKLTLQLYLAISEQSTFFVNISYYTTFLSPSAFFLLTIL